MVINVTEYCWCGVSFFNLIYFIAIYNDPFPCWMLSWADLGGGQRGHAPKMALTEVLSRFCLKRTKFDQLILAEIVKIVAIRIRCHS